MINIKNILFFLVVLLLSCEPSKKNLEEAVVEDDKIDLNEDKSIPEKEMLRTSFYFSLSDNLQSEKVVNKKTVDSILLDLKGDKKSLFNYYSILNISALSNGDQSQIIQILSEVSLLESKKDINFKLQDEVKLDLVMYSIRNNNFHMALGYLSELEDSEKPRLKATASNIRGVLAFRQGRIPEAIDFWKKAIEYDLSYNAAHLNIGFLLLSSGFIEESQEHFLRLDEDWLALSALIVTKFMQGDKDFSSQNCSYLLSKKTSHKPTLINCSLTEIDRQNYPIAKKWLGEALKIKSSDNVWDEKIYKLLENL